MSRRRVLAAVAAAALVAGCGGTTNPRGLRGTSPTVAPEVISDHVRPAWTWRHQLDLDTLRPLFAVGDDVLVSETRRAWLLSADGTERWSAPLTEDVDWAADLPADDAIVGRGPDDSATYGITVLDRADGHVRWRSKDTYVATTAGGVLAFRGAAVVVHDARTGRVRWTLPGPDASHVPQVAATSSAVYAVEHGRVARHASATGQVVWSRAMSGIEQLRPSHRLVLVSRAHDLTALDTGTGRVVWTRHSQLGVLAAPLDAGTTVYRPVASNDEDGPPARFRFVDAAGRTIGSLRLTDAGSPPGPAFRAARGVHLLAGDQVYDARLHRVGRPVRADQLVPAYTGIYGITDRRIAFTRFGGARPAWSLAVPPPSGLDALVTDHRLCVPLPTGVRCYR